MITYTEQLDEIAVRHLAAIQKEDYNRSKLINMAGVDVDVSGEVLRAMPLTLGVDVQ